MMSAPSVALMYSNVLESSVSKYRFSGRLFARHDTQRDDGTQKSLEPLSRSTVMGCGGVPIRISAMTAMS